MVLPREDRAFFHALADADVVVAKGGSYLHSLGGLGEAIYLWRMLYPLRVAHAYRRRTVLLGVSFGTSYSIPTKAMLRRTLRSRTRIYARERISLAFAEAQLGIDPEDLHLIPDVAFLTSSEVPERPTGNDLRIGVTVRYSRFPGSAAAPAWERYTEALRGVLGDLLRRSPRARVVFIPQVLEDIPLAREIAAGLADPDRVEVIDADLSIEELLGLYGGLEILIGTRLHSIILAATAGVPFVHISVEHAKSQGTLEMLGMEGAGVPYAGITEGELADAVRRVLANRREISERLELRVEEHRENLRETLATCLDPPTSAKRRLTRAKRRLTSAKPRVTRAKRRLTRAKPRLCLITHARFPIGEPRAERAARAASGDGYRVAVIALRGEGERAHERLEGIDVWRLPIRHRRGAPIGVMALEYCSFTLLAGLWALALRLRGKLDVVEVQRRVELVACALADSVLTVHHPYKEQLTARGADGAKIAIVMNTPEEALIAAVKSSPSQLAPRGAGTSLGADASPPNGDDFTVAYHGTITRWYGVDLLIEALGLLHARERQVRAVILGEGDQLEAVRELAVELGVSDSVSFSNRYLPIEEALRAVAGTDCGIISNRPSEINRFILPNKLFEYVALGIPVVSARLETVAAHFDDEDVTFCRPGDPESLAGAIAWVMDERVAAKRKSASAQVRADPYRWDANRARYLEVLRELRVARS